MLKTYHGIKVSDKKRTAIKADGTRVPVVDGKFSVLLQPNEDDIKHGVKGDPSKCMYVLACRRQFGSDMAWFARGVAYIELKVKGGKSVLQRFLITKPAKENIKSFDAGLEVVPEAVMLEAPKGTRAIGVQAAKYHERKQREKEGKAPRKAWVKGEKGKKREARHLATILRDSGTGMFQFTEHGTKGPSFSNSEPSLL